MGITVTRKREQRIHHRSATGWYVEAGSGDLKIIKDIGVNGMLRCVATYKEWLDVEVEDSSIDQYRQMIGINKAMDDEKLFDAKFQALERTNDAYWQYMHSLSTRLQHSEMKLARLQVKAIDNWGLPGWAIGTIIAVPGWLIVGVAALKAGM